MLRKGNLSKDLIMNAQDNRDYELIDHKTSRSICDAVGERLHQKLRPETELPSRLRELVDELRQRDHDLHRSRRKG